MGVEGPAVSFYYSLEGVQTRPCTSVVEGVEEAVPDLIGDGWKPSDSTQGYGGQLI